MNHKLQNFSTESDGQYSVGRDDNSTSHAETARNDAGSASAGSDDFGLDPISTAESRASDSLGSESTGIAPASSQSMQTPGRAASSKDADVAAAGVRRRPDLRKQQQKQNPQPRAAVPQTAHESIRCEVSRSDGYDPTGENAVACGALAQVLCDYCGPMCSSCAEETFCFQGEHKLSSLEEPEPARQRSRRTRRISEVVYVEIKCPNCRRVRLALPKKHRPKARRKCPVCKREAPAEYLAHGFTRRRLPYHEVFEDPPLPNELTILPDGKRRLPWDVRDLADYRRR